MKIRDFLYRLHNPKSISKEELNEMQNSIAQSTYLSTLDTENSFEILSYHDTSMILESYSKKDYLNQLNDKNILISHEMNHLPKTEALDQDSLLDELVDNHKENKLINEIKFAEPFKPKRELYQTVTSEYVKFLNTLPPCKSPESVNKDSPLDESENPLKMDSKSIHEETDQLIRSSLELKQGISSESLANLWASQGKPELAIQMYEKLAIEFPEKSATFAAKIEKLKSDNSL